MYGIATVEKKTTKAKVKGMRMVIGETDVEERMNEQGGNGEMSRCLRRLADNDDAQRDSPVLRRLTTSCTLGQAKPQLGCKSPLPTTLCVVSNKKPPLFRCWFLSFARLAAASCFSISQV